MSIPITAPKPNDVYSCSYYDPSSSQWTTLPTQPGSQPNNVQCLTNHLSQFAVLATRSDQRALVVAVVAFLDVFFVVSLLVAWCLDRREKRDNPVSTPGEQSINIGGLETEGDEPTRHDDDEIVRKGKKDTMKKRKH